VERCPANHTAFRCPIGPFSPGELGANAFGWRFEVNAHISDRTNDFNRCTEGQAARGTITRGGAVIANGATDAVPAAAAALPFPNPPAGALVANPNPYPAAGAANWGADDYTAPRDFKRHSETLNRIRWLDAPRVPRAGAAAITDRRIFVAWVTGNLGTCWCQFEINHEWTAAGGRTGPGGGAAPNRVTRIAGQNCGL
jgi:hypothetical protein